MKMLEVQINSKMLLYVTSVHLVLSPVWVLQDVWWLLRVGVLQPLRFQSTLAVPQSLGILGSMAFFEVTVADILLTSHQLKRPRLLCLEDQVAIDPGPATFQIFFEQRSHHVVVLAKRQRTQKQHGWVS